jgi:hypothetical protein
MELDRIGAMFEFDSKIGWRFVLNGRRDATETSIHVEQEGRLPSLLSSSLTRGLLIRLSCATFLDAAVGCSR